jgi:hypothetical protein
MMLHRTDVIQCLGQSWNEATDGQHIRVVLACGIPVQRHVLLTPKYKARAVCAQRILIASLHHEFRGCPLELIRFAEETTAAAALLRTQLEPPQWLRWLTQVLPCCRCRYTGRVLDAAGLRCLLPCCP